jgi:HK97 family phage portal protein
VCSSDLDDRQKTDETGLYDILHTAANDEMSAYNFKEMGMYQINIGGNLVCLKKKGALLGQTIGLQPLNWEKIEICRDKDTNRIQYKFKPDGVTEKIYTRDDVFHVPGPSLNGINGMSPLEYAAQAIRLGLTYEKFAVNFFKNGANASGIFKHPGFLKDEAYKRLKNDLQEQWQGLQNAGKPILAEDGLDFLPFQLKLVDAELLSSKKFQIEDICRVYRVPLHLVQNLDQATNNNIEHQSLEFVMYTMLPWFKRWEDCINCQLLTKEQRGNGFYMEFNMSSLLRGDQKSMAEAFAQGRQWGWLSVNDIRRLLNLNKIKNGDIYLQPMNMIEAGSTVDTQTKAIVNEVHKLIEESKK